MTPRLAAVMLATLMASSSFAQSAGNGSTGKKDRGRQPQPSSMNCEQISASSHGTITVEACKQMMGMQQAYQAAAADPSASRPGDDKMTCDQIAAEMKQQTFTRPDQAKVTEAQQATTDLKTNIDKQGKEAQAEIAKETAESSVVSKLAPVNAAANAENKRIEAAQKRINERAEKELTPKAERAFTANAGLMADAGKQLTENPRLARLFQMATQKQCKIQ